MVPAQCETEVLFEVNYHHNKAIFVYFCEVKITFINVSGKNVSLNIPKIMKLWRLAYKVMLLLCVAQGQIGERKEKKFSLGLYLIVVGVTVVSMCKTTNIQLI